MRIQTSDDPLRPYKIYGKIDMQITGAIMNDKEDDSFLAMQVMDTYPRPPYVMQTAVMPKRPMLAGVFQSEMFPLIFSLLELILENNRLKEGNGLLKKNEWGLAQKNECCNSK